jgi:hypothetical protein
MGGISFRCAALIFLLVFSACGTLVAPYDTTFDQTLNKLSEDTAKFVAAASSGGNESKYTSKETVAYYASTYNILDRLMARARLSRGLVPCPTNETLKAFVSVPTSKTALPEDYQRLDCREFQLYAVRLYVDQLDYAHRSDGSLNKSEAKALGGVLQASILGAIQTFVANKPST